MGSSFYDRSPSSISSSQWELDSCNAHGHSTEQLHSPSLHYSKVFGPKRPVMDDKFVDWTGPNDPHNPFNWRPSKKWMITLLACFMTFLVQVNGTMMTSAAEQINETFRVSDEHFPHSYWPVLSWNLGSAAAPMLGLPLMENFGVRWSYLVCSPHPGIHRSLISGQIIYASMIIFIAPQVLAKNFATLIVTRIITGGCSGVLANITSGIVSDIWREGRAKSFGTSLYIWGLLAGLSTGPVLGSVVVQYASSWRWYVSGSLPGSFKLN